MEYGLFATAVIRLASLGEEWESRLDTLLDAGGDDSPTFRGTPKRLDVALAEEIKATLLTGRLDPQADIWRRLPLQWLLPALGRTHEAFVLPEEEKEADALLLPDAARTSLGA